MTSQRTGAGHGAAVDGVWKAFKLVCQALRSARMERERTKAVEDTQTFLSDDLHRKLVHRWHGWGLLLSGLLRVIKVEMAGYLGQDAPGVGVGSSASGRKRKFKPTTKSKKLPRLHFWHYLRTELEAAHVLEAGPVLHYDPNGREFLSQLFAFAVSVVGRELLPDCDASFEAAVETEAWQTVQTLVQFRTYCAVLEESQMEDMLELALGSFSAAHGSISEGSAAVTRAQALQQALRNCPFDLHKRLDKPTDRRLESLVVFFTGWFDQLGASGLDPVALKLLEALTDLMRACFGSIGPLMFQHGLKVLHFICRSWERSTTGLRGPPAEFIMLFLEMYRFNADAMDGFDAVTPVKLVMELKRLVGIVLKTKEMNRVLAHANSGRGATLGRTGPVTVDMDDLSVRHLACAADVIFQYDCLVLECIVDGAIEDEASVGDKRPRPEETPLAWETLMENVSSSLHLDADTATAMSLATSSSALSSSGWSSSRDLRPSQANRAGGNRPRDPASWLLLLLATLSRHGGYYVSTRIGDVMMVMKCLADTLITKEIGRQQFVALQALIQLANLAAQYREECDETLSEHWQSVWQSLLRPDLPYFRATEGIGLYRGQVGDSVLTLLNCCVSFDLVPLHVIETSSSQLWNLPAFQLTVPGSAAGTSTPARTDGQSSVAGTSLASICAILTLLRHVQMPSAESVNLQRDNPFPRGDNAPGLGNESTSAHSRLLQTIFEHLRTQVFDKRAKLSAGTSSSRAMKVDLQTEISSGVYASAIHAFFRQVTPSAPSRETIFVPELIRKFAAKSLEDCDGGVPAGELNGFGVSFCMHESGLDYLSLPFPMMRDADPAAFPLVIQAFLDRDFAQASNCSGGLQTDATRPRDQFETLAVPVHLLRDVVSPPSSGHIFPRENMPSYACYDRVLSISKTATTALQAEVSALFSGLLTELSDELCLKGTEDAGGMRVLANSLDIGLILAVLFADQRASLSQDSDLDNRRVHTIPLLKRFLGIVAEHLKPTAAQGVQSSLSIAEDVMRTLMKFHAIILVLQGRETLEKLDHPSASPVKLQFPSDLRASIRKIVNTLEELLAGFSSSRGSGELESGVNQHSTSSRSAFGTSSAFTRATSNWELGNGNSPMSISQTRGTPAAGQRDDMDISNPHGARDQTPSRLIQRSISLWCFRVLLLLKKDSGLQVVKDFSMEVQFEPDFLLAVAVLLCGVGGSDSLAMCMKMADYAAEEATREGGKLAERRSGSFSTLIFLCEALSVSRLGGLMYEKRKAQMGDVVPTLLVQCAKRNLKAFAELPLKPRMRMARIAELQCLEMFFRLDPDQFEEFVDVAMRGSVDEDLNVRIAAARGLQSMYFMYPDGGPQVFQDFYEHLESLLPGSEGIPAGESGSGSGSGSMVDQRAQRMESCLSVLLSLYVCACSSHSVVPAVLSAFVKLASSNISVYSAGASSILHGWLVAIARFYGYLDASSLLDEHFCSLWDQYLSTNAQLGRAKSQEDQDLVKRNPDDFQLCAKDMVEQFPLSALLGEDCDAHAHRAHFAQKLDVIFPIGVLHDSIAGHANATLTGVGQFPFVDELVSLFFHRDNDSDRPTDEAFPSVSEQIITDLYALSFILQSCPDPALNEIGLAMLAVAEERARRRGMSFSHLGHMTSKMARFTIWDITQGASDQISTSELWELSLGAMKNKYSGFNWALVNVAEVLSDFYVILLRAELYGPRAVSAVECFRIFVPEIREVVATNPVLQQLLLSICFQSLKHLGVRHGKEVTSNLALLVRETCEEFMKKADTFGKYLGFVVQEISEILACCSEAIDQKRDTFQARSRAKRALKLDSDDQARLEWVIFAVCNNLATGLGKYALDIDAIPKGVAASLDKLDALIASSRKTTAISASQADENADMNGSPSSSSRTVKQQVDTFISRENVRGSKFYNPLSVHEQPRTKKERESSQESQAAMAGQSPLESSLMVRLSALGNNVSALRGTSYAANHLYGKLAHVLLYMSAETSNIQISGEENDHLVGIADALGELGSLDASEYELSPGDQRGELSRLYKRHFHRGALRETKTAFPLAMHESLLVYLSSLLFERRGQSAAALPEVIQEALKTMKTVLNLDDGLNVLKRSRDSELKAFLKPFAGSSPSNWSSLSSLLVVDASGPRAGHGRSPHTLQQHVELWKSAGKLGFEVWVCTLTACLASQSSDPVFKACAGLVAIRVDLAIFLFPYVLQGVLASSMELGESSRPASAANQGIRFLLTGKTIDTRSKTTLSQAPAAFNEQNSRPLEAVQLVVHAINFLRETEKVRFVGSNGKELFKSGAPGKGKLNAISRSHLSSSSTTTDRLNQPAYGCMVDMDLLDIAVAAVRVKMPYSAMQYVEMWLEQQHDGTMPSLSTLGDGDLNNKLRGILVSAYSFDNNADGIYGVNDSRTMESQLVTYNREGDYAKALPLYDVALQFSDPRVFLGENGIMIGGSSRFVEGMAMSLQKLGYNHLLEGYLQSAEQYVDSSAISSPNSGYAQLVEHKYELAWKNLQWDAVMSGPTSLRKGGGQQSALKSLRISSYSHQQTMFQALRAMAHEDFAHLRHVTAAAKKQVLQSVQLSLRAFESTQDSYRALLHLHSIREVEEMAALLESSTLSQAARSESLLSTEMRAGFNLAAPALEASASSRLGLKAMPLFEQWQRRYPQIHKDIDKIESLLTLEETLLRVSAPSDGTQALTKLYLSLASFSRKSRRVAVAYKALLKLQQLDQHGQLGIYEKIQWKMEKARLLWSRQEGRSAIWTAKQVCSELAKTLATTDSMPSSEITALKLLQVAVLTVTGKWVASQRSESSQLIIEAYFQKATDIVESMGAEAVAERVVDASKAHFALGEYMADMYQQVSARVASREWQAGKRVIRARDRELNACLNIDVKKQRESRAHIHALNKEVLHDIAERTKVEESVDLFLLGALQSIGKGLSLSPHSDLAKIFRVLSLWFSNQLKEGVNRVVHDDVITVVPSYKFVPLSYQIISRIGSGDNGDAGASRLRNPAAYFQDVLSVLILKLSEQHPHHTLVQLIALKNSGDVEGKGALQFRANVGDAKAEGARVFLDKLRQSPQRELLESLDILASAYVQLALFDTTEYHKGQNKKIPLSKVPILGLNPSSKSSITSFDQCLRDRGRRQANRAVMPMVMTCSLSPQPDMDYSRVVRVHSFEHMFSITDTGIHRPKILYCYGSDGQRYKQLVKGQDDTRQDLVIEQAFETVNQFLREEHETSKRQLRLRTYRVVPLSPIAGVLEWVENTTPWGAYLVGRTTKRLSAHERYHPREWKHTDCRTYLKNASDKLTAYSTIEKNFTPVFHHFFLEKFPDACMWYRRRLAFVQSVAVTSIVGYILGIGDRHSQNILVHEDTGELVHIDFGVVFDQGMALFTPETVPFRLTRDLVDGMGVSGVDGVFSRCCEATLSLLRQKSASVVTILEVFVHDPLYRWTLSPLKALRIQEGGERDGGASAASSRRRRTPRSGDEGREDFAYDSTMDTNENTMNEPTNTNDAAARALIRVKQKLEGYEDPNGNALSIEGQVKQLVSAARDPHNLCRLFPGWAPWL